MGKDVSETGSVSVLRSGGKTFRKLHLFPSSGVGEDVSETDPFSETPCFLVPRILDDGKSPKTQ
jgi:hypothetical protein